MSDAINAAIAAAAAEAAKIPEAQANSGGAIVATTSAVPAVGGAPRSLDDFLTTAAMNVEVFLAVSELGIRFGKDTKIHDDIDVTMNFGNAKFGYSLRFNGPGGVQYLTSWDGLTEARSRQNWGAVIADAKKMDGSSYPSDLVEVPVILQKDYARKEGGVIKTGTVVGLSLSYQKCKAFGAFLKDEYPKQGKNDFNVRLTAVAKKGSGQDYGVFGFEVLGAESGKKAA